MPFLIIESGPESGRRVELRGALVIGRQAKVGLSIQDVKASREHTRLEPAAGGWAVIDLESRNGTQLNGRKIAREFLAAGDRITVGQTVLRFETDDANPHATTRPMKDVGAAGAAPVFTPVSTPTAPPALSVPVAVPAAAPPPAASRPMPDETGPEEPRKPTLRYQEKSGGIGIVTLLVCLAVLAGLVFASRWIGQKAIGRIMEEQKAKK